MTEPETCDICGSLCVWTECWHCGGDGYHEDEDEDYDDVPCCECSGNGGYMECERLPHTDEQMRAWRGKTGKT